MSGLHVVYNGRKKSIHKRDHDHEFYIDGRTYPTSTSDLVTVEKLAIGEFTSVSVKLHNPSNKHVVEKRIRKINERNQKYINFERDLITLIDNSHSDYIVKFYGFLEDEVELLLYMERMSCCFRSLISRVSDQNATFPPLLLHSVAYSVVQALIFLKDKNILHRDIKPSNILINKEGQIKLADFGLSKESEDGTANSKGIGTYEYNAPERMGEGKENHSFPSDIWSAGVTLHELARLINPFREMAEEENNFSKLELMLIVKTADPPPALEDSDIDSPDFVNFVNSCVQFKPDDRIQLSNILAHPVFSVLMVNQDISQWLNG